MKTFGAFFHQVLRQFVLSFVALTLVMSSAQARGWSSGGSEETISDETKKELEKAVAKTLVETRERKEMLELANEEARLLRLREQSNQRKFLTNAEKIEVLTDIIKRKGGVLPTMSMENFYRMMPLFTTCLADFSIEGKTASYCAFFTYPMAGSIIAFMLLTYDKNRDQSRALFKDAFNFKKRPQLKGANALRYTILTTVGVMVAQGLLSSFYSKRVQFRTEGWEYLPVERLQAEINKLMEEMNEQAKQAAAFEAKKQGAKKEDAKKEDDKVEAKAPTDAQKGVGVESVRPPIYDPKEKNGISELDRKDMKEAAKAAAKEAGLDPDKIKDDEKTELPYLDMKK